MTGRADVGGLARWVRRWVSLVLLPETSSSTKLLARCRRSRRKLLCFKREEVICLIYLCRRKRSSLLKKVGLPGMRFHDLRHSAATIMLTMVVHPKIVQEILGHSSISVTLNTYSHVLPSLQREVMNTLGNALALAQ